MLLKLQRVVAQGGLHGGWSNSGRMVRSIFVVLLSLLLEGCSRPSVSEPVTLTLLDEWLNQTFSEARQQVAAIHSGNRNPSQSPPVSGVRAAKASFVARITRDRRLGGCTNDPYRLLRPTDTSSSDNKCGSDRSSPENCMLVLRRRLIFNEAQRGCSTRRLDGGAGLP
jgi:hypothetical protein